MNFLKIMFFLFIPVFIFSLSDEQWKNRSNEENAIAAYNYYKIEYGKNPCYESAWKYSRIAQYYGYYCLKDKDEKLNILTEAKNSAHQSINYYPGKPEGYYNLAVSMGSWAETYGILKSLETVPLIIKELQKLFEIDESFNNGAGLVLCARIYHKAPKVISIGDMKKAKQYFQKALIYGKDKNRILYRFYAEYLLDVNQIEKADEIIKQGLQIAFDNENILVENLEIMNLKKLAGKISNKEKL